ncbi:MAG: non-canonical purine NTP pyrophosphatase [Gemmatimonadales bacterium]|nr:MAG: non-canonical purine NTP pyrophosphatase [Gemmatimonadales bacterium]
MKVLLATRNAHKLLEVRQILADGPARHLDVLGPDEAGIPPSPEEEHIEAFESFEENAMAKARWFGTRAGIPTLADDSGLEVDLLDGRPGVRSRRFAPLAPGEPEPEDQDRRNIDHLLDLLGDAPLAGRTGRFVCVAALWVPEHEVEVEGGREQMRRGEAAGLILGRPRGWEGFGYDPVFLDPPTGRTFAEMTAAEKRRRGHRGAAFRAIAPALATLNPVRGPS